ncbi:hypothetical protein Bbelb_277240 [Branchiostoma belcheri]|nr:hypothetical protein Bbelb_277240 [Branchiostoma belcheri]
MSGRALAAIIHTRRVTLPKRRASRSLSGTRRYSRATVPILEDPGRVVRQWGRRERNWKQTLTCETLSSHTSITNVTPESSVRENVRGSQTMPHWTGVRSPPEFGE